MIFLSLLQNSKMTIKQFLVDISRVLDELKIEYAVSGGIAVSVWGRPRYTADLDIVIEISSKEKIEALTTGLLKKFKTGYLDKETALSAYYEKGEFNLVEPEYGLKADFFVSDDTEYAKEAMRRRKDKKIGEKMETKYNIVPALPKPISPEIIELYQSLKINLNELYISGDPFNSKEINF